MFQRTLTGTRRRWGWRRKSLKKDFCGKKSSSSAGVSNSRDGLVFLAQVETPVTAVQGKLAKFGCQSAGSAFLVNRESGNGVGTAIL